MKVIIKNIDNKTAVIKEKNTYSVINNNMKKTHLTLDAAVAIYNVLQEATVYETK